MYFLFRASSARFLAAAAAVVVGERVKCSTDTDEAQVSPRQHDTSIQECMSEQSGCRDSARKKRLASRCLRMVQQTQLSHGIPGFSVTITYNGQTVLSTGDGYADVENGVRCSSKTVMRIASISKPLTAVALLQLWQQKKIDLDAPIQRYVPNFPEKSFNGVPVTITPRHLLSHTGGIRHYQVPTESKGGVIQNTKEYFNMQHYDTVEESLKLFADDELIAKPGAAYKYTTYGWTLLGAVIEAASGMEYLKYMKHCVFKPLGMSSTGPEYHQPLMYHRARYYWRDEKHRLQNCPYVNNSCKWAGGGFVSTTRDIVKFGNSLLLSYNQWQRQLEKEMNGSRTASKGSETVSLDNEMAIQYKSSVSERAGIARHGNAYILNPATVAMMWRPVVTIKDGVGESGRVSYGMGWFVEEEAKGVFGGRDKLMTVSHTGGAVGASSVLTIIPGRGVSRQGCPAGVVVAVLFNQQEVEAVYELGKKLAEMVYWSLCDEGASNKEEIVSPES